MIGSLRGRIVSKAPPRVILEVSGVGYEIEMPLLSVTRLPPVGSETFLIIHDVVREEGTLLYGFIDETERVLFRLLLRVNGIGPKAALAVLSSLSVPEFVRIIRDRDAALLTRVPGIGKKTAERLVLELKDRIQDFSASDLAQPVSSRDQAVAGLIALGYRREEADRLLARLDPALPATDLIRESLKLAFGGQA
ncbi:Bacterial DNA recombination protein RuvA [mine drainage metagenome]|uniref:Bacterial DNA recombination protein RuvA n=2 Tax=mine drainage metagenome TaxID=410659 RepID=T1API5_9ZZZZ